MNNWKPISEAPDDMKNYLVYCGSIYVAAKNKKGHWVVNGSTNDALLVPTGGTMLANPTHWMDLPKGPIDE